MYMNRFVFKELTENHYSIWEYPSDTLLDICKDVGCIQQGHHELSDLVEDHNKWMWDDCINEKCLNCETHGFPCENLAYYCLHIPRLSGQWKA